MKMFKIVMILFTLLMLAGGAVFLIVVDRSSEKQVDVAFYNDQIHELNRDYSTGMGERELEEKYGCKVILGNTLTQELLEQIRNRAVIFDLTIEENGENKVIGKVAWEEKEDAGEAAKRSVLRFGIILWAVVLAGVWILALLVQFFLVRPILTMRHFSEEIAKGNLDIQLPVHKHNLFGNFTESFDIMREELKASKERELKAEKARKEMVADLSHDIKTPVATIQSTCEVLEVKHRRKLEELLLSCHPERSEGSHGLRDSSVAVLPQNDGREEPLPCHPERSEGSHGPQDSSVATLPQNDRQEGDSSAAVISNDRQKAVEDEKDILEKTALIASKVEVINRLMTNIFHTTLEELDHLDITVKEESTLILREYLRKMNQYQDIVTENEIPELLVYMDKQRTEQVLDNIIGNSVKYAGTKIRISFAETPKDTEGNKFVRIRIRDNGPGVPEDELSLITEKYYRGKNAKEQTGYGLGLYLVKTYMEKQGGGMECYNDDGFVVELYFRIV